MLAPLVLGPNQVPLVDDWQATQFDPELAVLSAIAHGAGPQQDRVLRAMLDGLLTVDGDHVALYSDVVMAALPEAARQSLEALMNLATYEPISPYFRRQRREGRREGLRDGKAKGRADALLAVLAARQVTVPNEVRARITVCTDLRRLAVWIRRAAKATTINEVVK